jgi:hypothetical protein
LIERRHQSLDEGLLTLLAGLGALPDRTLCDPDLLAQTILDIAPDGPRGDDTAVIVLALPRPATPRTRAPSRGSNLRRPAGAAEHHR